ncbi:MAG TPA: sialidase family protein [Prevotella sp.]
MNKLTALLLTAITCGIPYYSFAKTDAPTATQPTIRQGYHTTGQGNRDAIVLCIDMSSMPRNTLMNTITVALKGNTYRNIDRIKVYQTQTFDFYSTEYSRKTLLCSRAPWKGKAVLSLRNAQEAAEKPYLWITADVSQKAALEDCIDAKIPALSYKAGRKATAKTIVPTNGDPDYSMKIFALQRFLYTPRSFGSKHYRIPAMVVAADGSIVTAIDRRYGQSNDLGNHKIDVAVRRSTDNGRTWSQPHIIARGDSLTDGKYGYGDASLVRTKSGKLICMMSAGRKSFPDGMRFMAMQTSTDNGISWQKEPTEITQSGFTDAVSGKQNGLGIFSAFVTSGKGICTRSGDVMFLCDAITEKGGHEKNFLLKTSDEGHTWLFGPTLIYDRANEAKLLEKNDGTLLASVRQHGFRGFNTGAANGMAWNKQWRSTTLWGTDCNADILYYSRSALNNGKADMMLHSILKSKGRKNLCIYKSHDEGKTWIEVFNVQPGDAAYSTMELLNDGSVALLYEDNSILSYGHTINFVVLTKEQVEHFRTMGHK